ncbi:MAG: BatA domain-containing protein [Maioricimonas sp. JB049]
MSFLSFAFLAALPLAAAPILLHLFDRRRNVVIEWGAMQFLMEAATRRTSARRLKQWLLLLMRVMVVAALVLALARPMLPGSWFAGSDRTESIFVIDNSMSMLRTVDDVALLDHAIAQAAETLDGIEPGHSVRILLASPYPVWATPGSVRIDSTSRGLVGEALEKVRARVGGCDLLSALFTAVQAEIPPTQQNRRIILLTDGQAADWTMTDDAGWNRLQDVLKSAAVPTQLEIVELGEDVREAANVAVDRIRTSRTVVGIHQTFSLTAELQNHGRQSSPPGTLAWTVAGREQHESQVPALGGGKSTDVQWKHSFERTGVYAISCRVDADDALAPDNRATVVVEVVDDIPLLLLESAPDLAEFQRDAFFTQAALGWTEGEQFHTGGVHVPTLVDPTRLERMNLDEYRAVVIPNLQVLPEQTVLALQDFVFNGGGLWVALGPRTDVEAFNEHFFADGDGLAPLAIDGIVDEESARDDPDADPVKIDPFASEHPATAQLAEADQLDTGDVTVAQRFRFVPPPEGEPVSTLLGLTNGEPLAVEKYFGRGRVIVHAVPLRLQWSTLARSQAFVVMVHDWLAYLTQPRATRHNLAPGEPISVHVADASIRDATLRTPHGEEVQVTADAAGDGVILRTSRTILPGDYLLELGLSGDGIPFHVNRDRTESNLIPLTAGDHRRLADIAGVAHGNAESALGRAVQSEPLWPLLLTLVIALILFELLLSGIIARERFGTAPIEEATEPLNVPTGANAAAFRNSGFEATAPATARREDPLAATTNTN